MKKIFISIFIIALSFTFASSETSKTTDTNQTMSNAEFMKRFMALDKKEKEAIKVGETLDELNKLLRVDKQK